MEEHPTKSLNSLHFGHGTHFGKRGFVRIKPSDKDLVLIAGIVVAVIIVLTTFLFDSNQPQRKVWSKQSLPLISPRLWLN